VATAFLGREASGLPAVGIGAAALYAVWPLLTAPLAGTQAWENGQWFVDTGLLLYTVPLSTALATAAAAAVVAAAAQRDLGLRGRPRARPRDGDEAVQRDPGRAGRRVAPVA
jgi:hypothetical protein